jgi:hypothetical protein
MPASWEASTAAALEALEEVSSLDLIRTARAIGREHDSAGLFRFAGALRGVVYDRSEGCDHPSTFTRIQIESAVGSPKVTLRPAPRPRLQGRRRPHSHGRHEEAPSQLPDLREL